MEWFVVFMIEYENEQICHEKILLFSLCTSKQKIGHIYIVTVYKCIQNIEGSYQKLFTVKANEKLLIPSKCNKHSERTKIIKNGAKNNREVI